MDVILVLDIAPWPKLLFVILKRLLFEETKIIFLSPMTLITLITVYFIVMS